MHDLDRVFDRFTYTPELAEVAADAGLDDALVLQSMNIFKQPSIGGEVSCHQDATFLYTDPISMVGFWFALEDAAIDNGCLWAAPGAHRTGLRPLFECTGAMTDDGTVFEVPAGTMVLLDGLLPHRSDANRSGRSRHASTVHCISAAAEYPGWNWLRRGEGLPLRRLASVAT